jgi:lysophospholipase L1-like esterase
MKTIVCYGDSNTWGAKPLKVPYEFMGDLRFARDVRWTGRLQELLGRDYHIEEEGLNGRTTVFDDPLYPARNGLHYIDCCLSTKTPVDILVIMLGTNDVKGRFAVSPYCSAVGMGLIIAAAKGKQYGIGGKDPAILIIAPPCLKDNIGETWLYGELDLEAVEKSKGLAKEYRKIAEQTGSYFLDAAEFVQTSELDATHMDEANHAKLAEEVYRKIKEIT